MLNGLVHDHPFERIDLIMPRRPFEGLGRLLIAGLPPSANAGLAELDVLGVILVVEARCQQQHHVHLGHAAVARGKWKNLTFH
jgi:hypothetical protein